MNLVDVDGLLLVGEVFYQGSAENGIYFSILDESLVDLTLLLRGLEGFFLHFGLRGLPEVEDKLFEILSVY